MSRKSRVFAIVSFLAVMVFAVGVPVYAADDAAQKPAAKDTAHQKKATPAAKKKADTSKNTTKPADQAKAAPKNGEGASMKKVADVNGTIITQGQVDSEYGRYEKQLAMSGQTPDEAKQAEIKKQVLEGVVNREVLYQECVKEGVKATDAEVDEQIAQFKQRFQTPEQFTTVLATMNLTEDTMKAQLEKDMSIRKLVDKNVADKVVVTDEQAKAFYDSNPDVFKTPEMVRASHILIKADEKMSPEDKAKAREKLVEIQKRVKNGEDFATVAKESSECPSAARGGDLNFFQRGQMVKPFEDVAFSLPVNSVSDIVETQFGYHLIKVTEKKDAGTVSYDEVKDRIKQHLKQEQVNQKFPEYVKELRAKAKVEIVNQ
jgi:peptidyl-prolyl cis-trans isomerase C